jgi:hypothetical protein
MILPHLYTDIHSDLFSSVFLTRTSYAFYVTPTQATCLIHFILLNFIINQKHDVCNSGEEKKKLPLNSQVYNVSPNKITYATVMAMATVT